MDIFASQKYIWRLDELRSTYTAYFQKEKNRTMKRHFGLGLLIFLLYIVVKSIKIGREAIIGITFLFLTALIIVPIIYCYMRKKAVTRTPTKKEIAAVRKKHGKVISAIEAEIQELTSILKTSELPTQYHYAYAVNWMINAIVSKRADTLKEVINLYEEFLQKERHNQSITEAIKNINISYYY